MYENRKLIPSVCLLFGHCLGHPPPQDNHARRRELTSRDLRLSDIGANSSTGDEFELSQGISIKKFSYLNFLDLANIVCESRSTIHVFFMPEGSELAKGIKMKKILKFVPSRLLKSLT